MHDLGHADEGVEVEEDCERVEDVSEDHPGRLPEHLDLILLRFRVLQQETAKIKRLIFPPNVYHPESRYVYRLV